MSPLDWVIGCVWLALASTPTLGGPAGPLPEAVGSQLSEAQTPGVSGPPASGQKPPDPAPPQGQTSGKPPEPTGLQPLDLQGSRDQVASGTAFNPAMSVVPNVLYYADSGRGDSLALFGRADGFQAGRGSDGDHAHSGALVPGFNLREVEVSLSGAVDPYFDAMAIVAITGDGVGLEEAFVRTRRFLPGVQLKAGKFYSDIGYINRQHPHQWDFFNRNLAHELVFGDEGINEVGVQATWLPPLPVYVQLGTEILQGENERISNYLGPDEEHPDLKRAGGPRLFTGFAKVSPDLGFNHALQIGASVVGSRCHQEDDGGAILEGRSWVIGVDAVYKFDSPKPFGKGDLTVQGEYLLRLKALSLVDLIENGLNDVPREFEQDGFYVQGIYGFAPRWTAALRYEGAGLTNQADAGGTVPERFKSSHRVSAAVAFNPTHFSRLRFQVDRASLAVGGSRQAFTQAFVQLQVSLGVHGAHRF